jgi:hypothetical protein
MSICSSRHYVIRAVLLACLSLGWAASSGAAVVLDWDAVTWSPGDLTNSYDVTGDGLTDVTVKITSQQANIWAIDPTSGSQAPVVNQTLTGGLLPAQNSLMLAANLKTHSDATVQLNFTGGQYGANNVSFTIFDIDVTTNSDIISGIYGVALDGTHVAATLSNVGPTVTVTGSGLTYVLEGNGPAGDTTSNGNVTLSFGSTIITDIFFTFSNTAGAPRYQDIGIGDVTFTPVPEINPALTAAGSCLLAFGLTVVARKRAKNKASRLHAAQS